MPPKGSTSKQPNKTISYDSGPLLPLNHQRSLIMKLKRRDKNTYFHKPVDRNQLPMYYEVITEPMDFERINYKINRGAYKYLNEYVDDVMLICDNAMYFNEPESTYYQAALELKNEANLIFDQLRPLLPVQERPKTLENKNINNNNTDISNTNNVKRQKHDSPRSVYSDDDNTHFSKQTPAIPKVSMALQNRTTRTRRHTTLADNYHAQQTKLQLLQYTRTDTNTLQIGPLYYNDYRSNSHLPFDYKYVYRYQRYTACASTRLQLNVQNKLEGLISENVFALGKVSQNDYGVSHELLNELKLHNIIIGDNTTPFGIHINDYQKLQQYLHGLLQDPKYQRSFIKHTTAVIDNIIKMSSKPALPPHTNIQLARPPAPASSPPSTSNGKLTAEQNNVVTSADAINQPALIIKHEPSSAPAVTNTEPISSTPAISVPISSNTTNTNSNVDIDMQIANTPQQNIQSTPAHTPDTAHSSVTVNSTTAASASIPIVDSTVATTNTSTPHHDLTQLQSHSIQFTLNDHSDALPAHTAPTPISAGRSITEAANGITSTDNVSMIVCAEPTNQTTNDATMDHDQLQQNPATDFIQSLAKTGNPNVSSS